MILGIPARDSELGHQMTKLMLAAHLDVEMVWHAWSCPYITGTEKLHALGMLRLAMVAITTGATP